METENHMYMSITRETKEIMKQLIRNRFDALNQHELMTTGPNLITMAREMGYGLLAEEMANDLRSELPPQACYLINRAA